MSLLVALPAALVQEQLVAVSAGVALALRLVNMDHDVLLQVGCGGESLGANLTGEWLLSCVDLFVSFQI